MRYDRQLHRVAEVIRDTPRCPMYDLTDDECCAGLDGEGCDACLALVARAVLEAVEEM